jgi:putative DNA primase/helicase
VIASADGVLVENIPAELKATPQWVTWRSETRKGKQTKIPYQASDWRRNAKTNTPATWASFDDAIKAYHHPRRPFHGIGWVFAPGDGIVGIDIDNCLTPDGEILEWAQPYLARFEASYGECSPSGRGVKFWVRGKLPGEGTRRAGLGPDGTGAVEMYDSRRFFTLTGRIWDATACTIVDLQDAVDTTYQEIKGTRKRTPETSDRFPMSASNDEPSDTSDEAIIERARRARNGEKFSALFDRGEIAAYASESEADMALACLLAFWTRDEEQIERLFRRSPLAGRGKVRERPDYLRKHTIPKALERVTNCYKTTRPNRQTDRGKGRPKLPPTAKDGDADPSRPLTDLGNAERLIDHHGGDLRYCHQWKKWLVWDGKRWATDNLGMVRTRARHTVREILREIPSTTDRDVVKQITDWQKASEGKAHITAMIQLAEAEEGIPILPDKLDSHPWLFNCNNGTIDLRTGTLQPHSRSDLITKLCPWDYDPNAPCPLWLNTLNLFLRNNQELIGYFQRICGMALTGAVRDHVLPIAYGTGSNGKSTILGTLLAVFGLDFAMKANYDLLMAKSTETHPTDKADLFGKRLVVAIETEAGRRLNETMVKELTGGDRIRARRMREDFWEFSPTHTLIMATNHQPMIRGTDKGIWRRLKLIPFTVAVEDEDADKAMPEKLQAEYSGILAWCVRGCLAWQAKGLGEPAEVAEATAKYRVEQDLLGRFIEEWCFVGAALTAKAGTLYEHYVKWAESGHERVMTQTAFGRAIQERESITKRPSNGVWYDGIGLRSEQGSGDGQQNKPESTDRYKITAIGA